MFLFSYPFWKEKIISHWKGYSSYWQWISHSSIKQHIHQTQANLIVSLVNPDNTPPTTVCLCWLCFNEDSVSNLKKCHKHSMTPLIHIIAQYDLLTQCHSWRKALSHFINVMSLSQVWFIVGYRLNISKDWKWISYWSLTGLGHI